jgi:hypothetical protein
MGVGGQRHAPAAVSLGKRPVPIVHEAGWAPGPVWTGAENQEILGSTLYQPCYILPFPNSHFLVGGY